MNMLALVLSQVLNSIHSISVLKLSHIIDHAVVLQSCNDGAYFCGGFPYFEVSKIM